MVLQGIIGNQVLQGTRQDSKSQLSCLVPYNTKLYYFTTGTHVPEQLVQDHYVTAVKCQKCRNVKNKLYHLSYADSASSRFLFFSSFFSSSVRLSCLSFFFFSSFSFSSTSDFHFVNILQHKAIFPNTICSYTDILHSVSKKFPLLNYL